MSRRSLKYAAPLKSSKNGLSRNVSPAQRGVLGLLSRAASVPGLNAVDLYFPDMMGMDPVAESSANIATVEAMREAIR